MHICEFNIFFLLNKLKKMTCFILKNEYSVNL